ncbi:aldolase/citrate lyase family protein [Humisphaera borealis]|uniref:HpcH/HpaI aldolase/citrate lyase family protein n=1 Tax=Humisphaera borealis TaxID=2807512 RepID=A0A7M2WXY7_9BACT|nr:HpcH/HpaI aldolase/citrate lyase family protein [Humisphaera borealis]QOV90397.1 HpcH/HpaI aldolase/citrate lyase family protein [Humisphaera borealis]
MNESIPVNPFKHAILAGRVQIGLWANLCNPIATEVTAGAGFDWLLIDAEHAPNDVTTVIGQLHAMTGGTAVAVLRPPWNDTVVIKRYLDIGVQNLLIPYIQNADEAAAAVAATRYPPAGVRGVASIHRANQYARDKRYFSHANDNMCVLLQLETTEALNNLEAIAAVPGVDGLFIGPSDLAASMGHLGNISHPEVRQAIASAIVRIHQSGKAAGILAPLEADARHWLDLGATFVAVGSDLNLLARHTEQLAARFKQPR